MHRVWASILDRFGTPTGLQNGAKIHSKSLPTCTPISKSIFDQFSCSNGPPKTSKSVLSPRRGAIFHISCLFVFEPIWASKNLPKGSQNRPQILQKCIRKFDQKMIPKNDRFGVHLGSILTPKMINFIRMVDPCLASWSRLGPKIALRCHLDLILDALGTDFGDVGSILASCWLHLGFKMCKKMPNMCRRRLQSASLKIRGRRCTARRASSII